MSQLITCPTCGERGWSKETWTCSDCNYEIYQEEDLLEENKNYFEDRGSGDEPQKDLSFWMTEQEDLTREMVNECLPKGKYNYRVEFPYLSGWGATEYHENDFNEADLFVNRHAETLLETSNCWREDFVYYVDMKGDIVEKKSYKRPVYPPYSGSFCCPCPRPTKIKISKRTLTKEGEYKFDGEGYFPTIPHETAHADPAVKRDPDFNPVSGQHDPSKENSPGHDEVWRNKQGEFYNKLRPYIKKVKDRFKEYRKITKQDEGGDN